MKISFILSFCIICFRGEEADIKFDKTVSIKSPIYTRYLR